MPKTLVTGAAGFIGAFTAARLCEMGHSVVGIDNLNDYYDPQLKRDRLKHLTTSERFAFHRLDLCQADDLQALFERERFDAVVHLAAQVGVRYSLKRPERYVSSNLVGFANILECCRRRPSGHLVFASSSSVYGLNDKLPYSVEQPVDHPVSLYAATKRSNELMAHVYSHLYGLPTTGLRFFTVYGPWGRPDMAYYLFAKAISEGRPVRIFNQGRMMRDFTYIDDIVEGLIRVLERPPQGADSQGIPVPFRLYNIGSGRPISLMEFIRFLEEALGQSALLEYHPMQPGDVEATHADVEALARDFDFRPSTPFEIGLRRFVRWYRDYHPIHHTSGSDS